MAIKLILNFRSRSRLRPGPGSFDWSRPGPGENLGPGRTIVSRAVDNLVNVSIEYHAGPGTAGTGRQPGRRQPG